MLMTDKIRQKMTGPVILGIYRPKKAWLKRILVLGGIPLALRLALHLALPLALLMPIACKAETPPKSASEKRFPESYATQLKHSKVSGASADQVFEILASEIAIQRGEVGPAYQTYLSLARQTGQAELAQRAMEIAIAANAPDLALVAAQTWDSLSPNQIKSKEVLVTLFLLNQRWAESVLPALAILNKQSAAEKDKTLLQWLPLFGRASDENAALRAYFEIVSNLNTLPKETDVLYTYSIAAEKSQRFDVMEKVLRSIIAKNPNNTNVLNALGYSFADRNIKLNEALELISKANRLAPQDGFILDSLGWVHFRLGNTELALKNLLEAFAMKPEADIAAHLGEVFWTLNRTQEAEKYWRMGEKLDANNATLKETIKRFKPEWIISNPKNQKQWDGRFAVKFKDGSTEEQGGSGGFTLNQNSLIDTLEIRNPIGGSIAKIVIQPGEAILEKDGKKISAIDADTLVQNTLGLPLPARGLSNWLQGEVRAGSPASLERDEQGNATRIVQDGWILAYIWSNNKKIEKLNMTRNFSGTSIDVRLVFDQAND